MARESWSVIDVECPWCLGSGMRPDKDDPTFQVECLCVTHYYRAVDTQPKLVGMEDRDIEDCSECGARGFHKLSCSRPWTPQWENVNGSGY